MIKEKTKKPVKRIAAALAAAIIIAAAAWIIYDNIIAPASLFVATLASIFLYSYFRAKMIQSARIRRMEEVFPDFIELMASNLRAGMTIDQALLLSSRKEFAPLDQEILNLGKDIVTGKDISIAMAAMAARIRSEKIKKTIELINSGIKSGGNLSVLLEDTAVVMRAREFIEKKASSNVLMYIIFIFFAAAIGAPILFALSSVLVHVMTKLLASMPASSESIVRIPFALTKVSISPAFVQYFSLIFLLLTNVLSSLLLGITNKGEEKAGLKYLIPMVLLSFGVFFLVRTIMLAYFSTLLG